MVVYKYILQMADTQEIELPEGAEILSVQLQHGGLTLWALVNPDIDKVIRTIEILTTGNEAYDHSRKFINTVQLAEGSLVYHFFERK